MAKASKELAPFRIASVYLAASPGRHSLFNKAFNKPTQHRTMEIMRKVTWIRAYMEKSWDTQIERNILQFFVSATFSFQRASTNASDLLSLYSNCIQLLCFSFVASPQPPKISLITRPIYLCVELFYLRTQLRCCDALKLGKMSVSFIAKKEKFKLIVEINIKNELHSAENDFSCGR